MVDSEETRVLFTDGFVVSRDTIIISGRLASLDEDEEGTRIFTFKAGEWFYFDADMTINSVCVVQKPVRTAYCLGWDGRILVTRAGNVLEELITDAGVGPGKFGYVFRIREVAERLFVCGGSGQIYRREDSGWVHVDEGILDPRGPIRAPYLNCIDGTSEQDMYAVGKRGWLWHYDGHAWTKLDPPTQNDLTWVRCITPDEVYLCGKNGTFLKGRLGDWQHLPVPPGTEHFWCVEHFEGKVYIASYKGLFQFDGQEVKNLDTGLQPIPDGHRLHSNDGVLWSFGTNHLCFFDGKKWTYVKHPDNP